MRSLFRFLCLALPLTTLVAASSWAEPRVTPPGFERFTLQAAHRARPLEATLWYPAGTRGFPGMVGETPLFKGVRVQVGPAPAEGEHPLFLLSHGSGGSMDSLSWLSAGLVAQGAMVLAVNHPGSMTGDSSPRRSLRLDDRARDLSAALDMLLADPTFAPHVDPSRITAIGFSLGGSTALAMAGLRYDPEAFATYCTDHSEQADCRFLARGGIDLTALPPGFAADMRDSRIARAIAIEPGMTLAATADSIATLDRPILLINVDPATRWLAADVGPEGSDLVHRLPRVRSLVTDGGFHLTMLSPCHPEAAERLAREGDDPICTDPPGTDRLVVHRQILESIAQFME